jgi:hypothetical protein
VAAAASPFLGIPGRMASDLLGAPDEVRDVQASFVGGANSLAGAVSAGVSGADSGATRMFNRQGERLRGLRSDAGLAAAERSAARRSEAEGTGLLNEIVAGIRSVGDDPTGMLAGGAGSLVGAAPAIIGAAYGAVPAALGLGATALLGGAAGAGSVRQSIYSAVQEELLATGTVTEEEVNRIASEAQRFGGEETGSIALGGILGLIASRTGLEGAALRAVGQRLGANIATKTAGQTATRGALRTAAGEALLEGAQGGQERLAANLALGNAGFDVDAFKGVAGAAAAEGTVGALLGGGTSILTGEGARGRATYDAENAREAANERPLPPTEYESVVTELMGLGLPREVAELAAAKRGFSPPTQGNKDAASVGQPSGAGVSGPDVRGGLGGTAAGPEGTAAGDVGRARGAPTVDLQGQGDVYGALARRDPAVRQVFDGVLQDMPDNFTERQQGAAMAAAEYALTGAAFDTAPLTNLDEDTRAAVDYGTNKANELFAATRPVSESENLAAIAAAELAAPVTQTPTAPTVEAEAPAAVPDVVTPAAPKQRAARVISPDVQARRDAAAAKLAPAPVTPAVKPYIAKAAEGIRAAQEQLADAPLTVEKVAAKAVNGEFKAKLNDGTEVGLYFDKQYSSWNIADPLVAYDLPYGTDNTLGNNKKDAIARLPDTVARARAATLALEQKALAKATPTPTPTPEVAPAAPKPADIMRAIEDAASKEIPAEEVQNAFLAGASARLFGVDKDVAQAVNRAPPELRPVVQQGADDAAARLASASTPDAADAAQQADNMRTTIRPPERSSYPDGFVPDPEFERRIQGKTLSEAVTEAAVSRYDRTGDMAYFKIGTRVADKIKAMEQQGFSFDVGLASVGDPRMQSLSSSGQMKMDMETGAMSVLLRDSKAIMSGATPEVLMHEAVHAVSSPLIREAAENVLSPNRAVYEELRALFKEVSAQVDTLPADLRTSNAMKNEREFMTWGLTNKPFQDWLRTVPVKGGNAWSAFVEVMRKLFGIDKAETNALSRLLEVSDKVFAADTTPASPAQWNALQARKASGEQKVLENKYYRDKNRPTPKQARELLNEATTRNEVASVLGKLEDTGVLTRGDLRAIREALYANVGAEAQQVQNALSAANELITRREAEKNTDYARASKPPAAPKPAKADTPLVPKTEAEFEAVVEKAINTGSKNNALVRKLAVSMERGPNGTAADVLGSAEKGAPQAKAEDILGAIAGIGKTRNADNWVPALKTLGTNIPTPQLKLVTAVLPTTGLVGWVGDKVPQLREVNKLMQLKVGQIKKLTDAASGISKRLSKFANKFGQDVLSYTANLGAMARVDIAALTVDPSKSDNANIAINVAADPAVQFINAQLPNALPDRRKALLAERTLRIKNEIEPAYRARVALGKQEGGLEAYKKIRNYLKNMLATQQALSEAGIRALGLSKELEAGLLNARASFAASEDATSLIPNSVYPDSYMSALRFGDYWLIIEGDQKAGRERMVFMRDSASERDNLLKEIAKEYNLNPNDGDVIRKGSDPSELQTLSGAGENALIKVFFEAIDKAQLVTGEGGQLTEAEAKKLKDDVVQTYLQGTSERSITKRFLHSKNVAGRDFNIVRVFNTVADQYSRMVAGKIYNDKIDLAVDAAQASLKGMPPNAQEFFGVFVTEMRKRVATDYSEGEGIVSAAVNRITFFMLLSSIASGLNNATFIPLRTFWALAPRYGYAKTAAKFADYFTFYNSVGVTKTDPLTGERVFTWPSMRESALFRNRTIRKRLYEAGDDRAVYTAQAESILTPGYKTRKATGKLVNISKTDPLGSLAETSLDAAARVGGAAMEATSNIFSAADIAARKIAFMVAAELEYEKSGSFDAAVDKGVAVTNDTGGNYQDFERPRFMKGNFGRILSLFKMFPLNTTRWQLTNLFEMTSGGTSGDKTLRSAAVQEFLGATLTGFAIHGLRGTSLFSVVCSGLGMLVKALADDDDLRKAREDNPLYNVYDNTEKWLLHVWLPSRLGEPSVEGPDGRMHTLANIIEYGALSELTNVNVGSRTGINNLWFTSGQEADSSDQVIVNTLVSNVPGVSMSLRFVRGVDQIGRGEVLRGLTNVSPALVRGVVTQEIYRKQGLENTRGKVVMESSEFSAADRFWTAVGFQPTAVADAQAFNFDYNSSTAKAEQERSKVLDNFYRVGTDVQVAPGQVNAAWEKINKHNERYPNGEYTITAPDLMASMRSRLASDATTVRGIRLQEDTLETYLRLMYPQEFREAP